MKVVHTTDGDLTIAELRVQNLDVGVVGDIKSEFTPVLDQTSRLIVDLGEVQFMDSSGAGLLVWLRRRTQAEGSALVLCGLSEQVHLVLDSLSFKRILTIAKDQEEAKALFDWTPPDADRS